jgi:hypothetical protein
VSTSFKNVTYSGEDQKFMDEIVKELRALRLQVDSQATLIKALQRSK